MPTYAKIRTDAVVLNPVADPGIDYSLFADSATNALSMKETSASSAIAVPSTKIMQAFSEIRFGKPVSKRPDGKIMEAESDGIEPAQQPIGIAMEAILPEELGSILLFGPNAKNVLAGLGFVPGDEIYVGESTGGYVNDITPFVDNDDSIIKVGIADCAEGVASAVAVDLVIFPQVIARP